MNMFRHDNIAEDAHFESAPCLLKSEKESLFHVHLRQQRKTVIAAESNEMGLAGTMKPLEALGHDLPCSAKES